MHHYTANALSIIALFFILFISSCEQYSNSGIEESVAFIESTTPIAEAQNVTMDLRSGVNSFALHLIELSNIGPNSIIKNGVKKSWCIEWDVNSINGIQQNVKLHSTEGQAYWNKLNYLLNRIDIYKQAYPELSYKEIQIAIWSVVDNKPFSIDDIPEYQNFPSTFYKDEEFQFNVSTAREIIEDIRSSADNGTFDKFAIVVENEGQIIVTTSE